MACLLDELYRREIPAKCDVRHILEGEGLQDAGIGRVFTPHAAEQVPHPEGSVAQNCRSNPALRIVNGEIPSPLMPSPLCGDSDLEVASNPGLTPLGSTHTVPAERGLEKRLCTVSNDSAHPLLGVAFSLLTGFLDQP